MPFRNSFDAWLICISNFPHEAWPTGGVGTIPPPRHDTSMGLTERWVLYALLVGAQHPHQGVVEGGPEGMGSVPTFRRGVARGLRCFLSMPRRGVGKGRLEWWARYPTLVGGNQRVVRICEF